MGTTVWGRVSEQSRKLALLYAISENHLSPEIGRAAAAVGRTVRHAPDPPHALHGRRATSPTTRFTPSASRRLQMLRKAPGHCLPHSLLLLRMRIAADALRKVVDTLEQRGNIVVHSQPTGGRPTRVYELVEGHRA